MSAVGVTCGRTVAIARRSLSSAFAIGGFLAACGAAFAFGLNAAEGGTMLVAAVWSASVAPFLPALAAFLAMDTWSEELRTGRVGVLLSSPVKERELVFGKFLGVWTSLLCTLAFALVSAVALLWHFAPQALEGVGVSGFLPGFIALAVQGALWCAVSVAASALFRNSAASACASLMVLVALPRGGWAALVAWMPGGAAHLGEMPLDAHVIDAASGVLPVGVWASYAILVLAALFACTKAVALVRLVGRGGVSLRASTAFSILLAAIAASLAIMLASHVETTVELPVGDGAVRLSRRTAGILSESSGVISLSCFMPRGDARFRQAHRLARALSRAAKATGGVRIDVRHVDPRWDLGAAERLIRSGAEPGSLVFEKGSRCVSVPVGDGAGERECALAIQSIAMPPQRRSVYWTAGHGEASFEAYGAAGMSDIARELARGGYRNFTADLATDSQIPQDCALVVVAGAKDDFSRAELGAVDAYLKRGGRMLVLSGSVDHGGVSSLLPAWGIRASAQTIPGARTISGSDVIVTDFTDHPIASRLKGSRIVLERPLSFSNSAAADTGRGADRIEFLPVARVGASAVAAVVERGSGMGSDLALRPTRIVVVGDAGFASNGALA